MAQLTSARRGIEAKLAWPFSSRFVATWNGRDDDDADDERNQEGEPCCGRPTAQPALSH